MFDFILKNIGRAISILITGLIEAIQIVFKSVHGRQTSKPTLRTSPESFRNPSYPPASLPLRRHPTRTVPDP